MPLNIPILLTWLRIVLIPLMIAVYYVPESWVHGVGRDLAATLIFVVAAATDWLDGYLARRLDQTSAFGAFLDPVADKLMVSAALLALLNLDRVDVMIALTIIGREITISALREWMAQLGASASVAVHWLGKFKTAAQMIAIPCLLYHADLWGIPVARVGQVLIVVAAILTVWSMLYYLRRAWPVILEKTS